MTECLNLANIEHGTINYEKVKYPDGQVSVIIDTHTLDHEGYDTGVRIKSRMDSYEDIAYILSTTDSLRYLGIKDISLFVPCFLGQRSDRRFKIGGSFDLKIWTDIINQQNYKQVEILYPHSDVLPALLNKCHPINVTNQIVAAERYCVNTFLKSPILISPDAGAYKRVFDFGEDLGLKVVPGNKHRNGKEIHLKIAGDVANEICIIVDDYCDGGRTFTQLAAKLKELGATTVVLAVAHGLFSNGVEFLIENGIDKIFTTNSIKREPNNFINESEII